MCFPKHKAWQVEVWDDGLRVAVKLPQNLPYSGECHICSIELRDSTSLGTREQITHFVYRAYHKTLMVKHGNRFRGDPVGACGTCIGILTVIPTKQMANRFCAASTLMTRGFSGQRQIGGSGEAVDLFQLRREDDEKGLLEAKL